MFEHERSRPAPLSGARVAPVSALRSIAGPKLRRGGADAANSEPAEDGVAPQRWIRRPGQIGSERGHVPASRIGENDLPGRRLRLSGGRAGKAEQGDHHEDRAHRHGFPILRACRPGNDAAGSPDPANAFDPSGFNRAGWIEPDATPRNYHSRTRLINSPSLATAHRFCSSSSAKAVMDRLGNAALRR